MLIKQVIVMRKDLKMRRGKEIAQGSHASNHILMEVGFLGKNPSKELIEWLNTGTTKVCVRVDSEQELMDIFNAAKNADLDVHLVTDAGRTEFNGVPTKTCLAIGPDDADEIDKITGHLALY
jgi:PTH2 family peptidyl-tRNA hydrolase